MRWLDKITVVSWGSFNGDSPERTFAKRQVDLFAAENIQHIFVDIGSSSPLNSATIFADGHSEAAAKNEGLSHVTTPYVAFTDFDTLVSYETISKTFDVIANAEMMGRAFIMQGYPWMMSSYLKSVVTVGKVHVPTSMALIANTAVVVAAPRMPMGSWQVCLTDDAQAVGGFDETIAGDPAADFHERMRAWVMGAGGGEVLTKAVPIVKSGYLTSTDPTYGTALDKFLHTADPANLRWNNGFI